MDVQTPTQLPNDVDQLKAIIEKQREALHSKSLLIDRMQTLLDRFKQQRYGSSSEKFTGQEELQFFNELELLAASEHSEDQDSEEEQTVQVPAHARRRKANRALPAELERIDVHHELDPSERQCSACGKELKRISEEVCEQLSIVPQQHFVLRNIKAKYACSCKGCMKTASMPAQPIPGSQASPCLLAHIMVQKFHDGLPLYRQEKIDARVGLDLSRSKRARWLIALKPLFQPLYNLSEEVFFSYDIALSDDTGIQVLKEDGREASTKSALWIRRGGPPDKPVVLVDYRQSKSGETAYSLLSHFNGYLVCEAAQSFNKSVSRNQLTLVHCNDHARRRFADIIKTANKKDSKTWVAAKAIAYYKKLYKIETTAKPFDDVQRHLLRQEKAVPVWNEFISWAQSVIDMNLGHAPSRDALKYLLGHQTSLREYCNDGRLPISNIMSEQVAKTIALSRKNFLFADTPAGASASAMIYSLLETAKANGHNVFKYMSVILSQLPSATSVEEIELLLPWKLGKDEVAQRFAALPGP